MRSGVASGFSRAWTRTLGKLSAPHGAVWSLNGPRLGASAILLTYSLVVVLAGRAIQVPGDLGLKAGACGSDVCVAWVMPSGQAWYDGARPGMRILSLNGEDARAAVGIQPLREAELLSPSGRGLRANVTVGAIALPWARNCLWLTGALFALLGAVVLVRRPDAPVARLFGMFTGFTSVALAVSPAAVRGSQSDPALRRAQSLGAGTPHRGAVGRHPPDLRLCDPPPPGSRNPPSGAPRHGAWHHDGCHACRHVSSRRRGRLPGRWDPSRHERGMGHCGSPGAWGSSLPRPGLRIAM